MRNHLKPRGRYFELPIIGHTLAELHLSIDRPIMLVFHNESGAESKLIVEESIQLSRGQWTQTLEGSRPGETFAPQTLQPLVELLGSSVIDALAQEDGMIRVSLSNNMELIIVPTHGYEGWHFHWESKSHPLTFDNFRPAWCDGSLDLLKLPHSGCGILMPNHFLDRIHGCLLGGAIGDAMGGPFENQPGPLIYREHSPWTVSDETQLTLATCEAIIEAGHVSPAHVASRFLAWYRERRLTGMGASTLKALRDLEAGAHWVLAGAKDERSAGNGAAMRIAPLAFLLDPTKSQDRQTIRDVCRITHHNDEAYLGALAIVAAIRHSSSESLFSHLVTLLPDSRLRDRLALFAELPDDLPVSDVGARFGTSGYVVESVPLALYAARKIEHSPLEYVLQSTIEAGGDTDTMASMAGHIAGAWCGASQIPEKQVQSLPNAAEIERIAHELNDAIQSLGD